VKYFLFNFLINHGISEKFRVPDRRYIAGRIRDIGPRETIEEFTATRIKQGTILIEGSILNHDGNFITIFTRLIVKSRCSTGEIKIVFCTITTDEPETCRSGIDIQSGDAKAMVVIQSVVAR
jgi:hypothetical protein